MKESTKNTVVAVAALVSPFVAAFVGIYSARLQANSLWAITNQQLDAQERNLQRQLKASVGTAYRQKLNDALRESIVGILAARDVTERATSPLNATEQEMYFERAEGIALLASDASSDEAGKFFSAAWAVWNFINTHGERKDWSDKTANEYRNLSLRLNEAAKALMRANEMDS